MSNRPILITGCQRSGTTLLNLILDSHPEVRGIDEMKFDAARLNEYIENPDYYPNVAFKLPAYAHAVHYFRHLSGLKVIWCVRDPRDVVLSMTNLKMNYVAPPPIAWGNHPFGAGQEILHCSTVLGYAQGKIMPATLARHRHISRIHPSMRSRNDAVFSGALCWMLKNKLLKMYDRNSISYITVKYEDLISNPESEVAHILQYLDLQWSDDVLRHHQLHRGISVGNTVNTRPIDSTNTGKWKKGLSQEELDTVKSLCTDVAIEFGYQLLE